MKNFSNKAFTLIELMVVIAIIAILILGSNFLSFNNISNKQKVETKAIKITNNLEEIRNNALLGRGIGIDLYVPKKYKIDFSTSGSGVMKTEYFSGATSYDYTLFNKDVNFSDKFESISQIKCFDLNNKTAKNTFSGSNIGTGTIFIEGSNMTLSGSCSSGTKILELEIKRKSDIKKIQINTLNGLIKIIK
ncbi:MAG: prepilin-type N-terminal cleavage/methylation domain-containing protein [Candidatus Gracilibacteria bacterium]|nr:prepilin-type N-terminal cleavage/methylation domain-containing protein [Candidatus Gracilibacteria bacterium]